MTNCFRFAPRDSVPGLISKICKYLKEHPGWSADELKEVIGEIETSLALGEISYFTNQSINDLDAIALYDVGYRFVFIGGGDVYSAMYALEESDGDVVANGVSLGVTESEFNQLKSIVLSLNNAAYTATNPPPYPVTKVNNRTGDVKLNLADVLGESTAQTLLMSDINFASTQLATWNAFYDYGYRVVGVLANDGSAITALYILGQNVGNHVPIPMALTSDGKVISVNGDIGEVFTLRVDPADPGIPTEPPTPINATTLNGRDAKYYLSPRNLLDNSDFCNPVNQRGKTSYSGNVYTIDRWKLNENTLKVGSDGITLVSDDSSSAVLTQYISGLRDGVYTQALNVNGTIYTRIIQLSGSTITTIDSSNAAYIGGYVNSTVSGSGYYSFHFRAEAGYNITVRWAALYEGSYAADALPPYTPKGYAAELAECYRYYQHSWDEVLNYSGAVQRRAYETTRISDVELHTPMRIKPTVTLYSPDTGTAGAVKKATPPYTSVSGCTVGNDNSKSFRVIRDTGGFVIGEVYQFHYSASADL